MVTVSAPSAEAIYRLYEDLQTSFGGKLLWSSSHSTAPVLVMQTPWIADLMQGMALAHSYRIPVYPGPRNQHWGGDLCIPLTSTAMLLVDFSAMTDVYVNPGTNTVQVWPGACRSTIEQAVARYHLQLTPSPLNRLPSRLRESALGCWLWQTYGLSPDKLLLIEYLTPQGEFRQYRCNQPFAFFHPLWQCRQDFGLIVSFTYRLESPACSSWQLKPCG